MARGRRPGRGEQSPPRRDRRDLGSVPGGGAHLLQQDHLLGARRQAAHDGRRVRRREHARVRRRGPEAGQGSAVGRPGQGVHPLVPVLRTCLGLRQGLRRRRCLGHGQGPGHPGRHRGLGQREAGLDRPGQPHHRRHPHHRRAPRPVAHPGGQTAGLRPRRAQRDEGDRQGADRLRPVGREPCASKRRGHLQRPDNDLHRGRGRRGLRRGQGSRRGEGHLLREQGEPRRRPDHVPLQGQPARA